MSDDTIPQKRCTKCGEFRPLTMFAKRTKSKDGLEYRCKICEIARYRANEEEVKARGKAYRENNAEHVRAKKKEYSDDHKEEKSAYDRARYESKREEILAQCKAYREANADVIRERKKKYYRENRERILAYLREWQAANAEYLKHKYRIYYLENTQKIKASVKRWVAANAEKVRQYKRNFYAANPEKMREKHRAYRSANRDKIRAYQRAYHAANPHIAVLKRHKRREQLLANGGTFSLEDYFELVKTQAGICAYCGNADEMTIEHIIPVTRGGQHDKSNICLACPHCNYSKQDKLLEEWVDRWYLRGK